MSKFDYRMITSEFSFQDAIDKTDDSERIVNIRFTSYGKFEALVEREVPFQSRILKARSR